MTSVVLGVLLMVAACSKEKASGEIDKGKNEGSSTPAQGGDEDKAPDKPDKPDKGGDEAKVDAGQFTELATYANGAADAMKSALLGKKVEGSKIHLQSPRIRIR